MHKADDVKDANDDADEGEEQHEEGRQGAAGKDRKRLRIKRSRAMAKEKSKGIRSISKKKVIISPTLFSSRTFEVAPPRTCCKSWCHQETLCSQKNAR